jgi:hypothetical protein
MVRNKCILHIYILSLTDHVVGTSSNSLATKSKVLKILANKPSSSSLPSPSLPYRRSNQHHLTPTSDAQLVHSSEPAPITPAKRSKLTRFSVKTRRVQPIERNADGSPKLPQQIGVLTVLNLGTIVTDRPSFHNERYIFPVGYTVSRYIMMGTGIRKKEDSSFI